jgi:hypothetical protein
VAATLSTTRKEFIELGREQGAEFFYLFKNGQWHWMPENGRNFRKLTAQTTD